MLLYRATIYVRSVFSFASLLSDGSETGSALLTGEGASSQLQNSVLFSANTTDEHFL